MHVSDLFPTLLSASGAKLKNVPNFDGVDQWSMINEGSPSPRADLFTIDDLSGFGSYIRPPFKFINGTLNATFDGWLSSKWNNDCAPNDLYDYAVSVLSSSAAKSIFMAQKENHLTIDKIVDVIAKASVKCKDPSPQDGHCNPYETCLFNIVKDPCERNNLASTRPKIHQQMKDEYFKLSKNISPSRRVKVNDFGCDPANFNNNWQWWQADTAEL
jgi:arylsulfatase B